MVYFSKCYISELTSLLPNSQQSNFLLHSSRITHQYYHLIIFDYQRSINIITSIFGISIIQYHYFVGDYFCDYRCRILTCIRVMRLFGNFCRNDDIHYHFFRLYSMKFDGLFFLLRSFLRLFSLAIPFLLYDFFSVLCEIWLPFVK